MMKREQSGDSSVFDVSQIVPLTEMEKKKNSRFYACLWKGGSKMRIKNSIWLAITYYSHSCQVESYTESQNSEED